MHTTQTPIYIKAESLSLTVRYLYQIFTSMCNQLNENYVVAFPFRLKWILKVNVTSVA